MSKQWTISTALAAACALLTGSAPAFAQWRFAHADSMNTGFARVDTLPARAPRMVPFGAVAPGVNPVVAPDGTVYVGDIAGVFHAFRADGTPYWTRKINSEHGSFLTTPAIGADGSIYVTSSVRRDAPKINETFLHKFTPGGGWVFARAYPKASAINSVDGGVTTGAVNTWESGGTEVVMVKASYRDLSGVESSLLAFSTDGVFLHRKQLFADRAGINVIQDFSQCEGNPFWVFICIYLYGWEPAPPLPSYAFTAAGVPMPGVAIGPSKSGSPRVVVTYPFMRWILSYSPQQGFAETSLSINTHNDYLTPPVIEPNGLVDVGTASGSLVKTAADFSQRTFGGFGMLTAAPSLHRDGSLLVVSRDGVVSKFGPLATTWQDQPGGESIASAASTCSNVYVSTTKALITYDVGTMQQVAKFDWSNGGFSSPVVGPDGSVYAIADTILHVFPGPASRTTCGL